MAKSMPLRNRTANDGACAGVPDQPKAGHHDSEPWLNGIPLNQLLCDKMPASIDKSTVLAMLSDLKRTDSGFRNFGSEAHRYELNPQLAPATVGRFESKHNVTLPSDYRLFITEIGNGGAGPYYGLFPFGYQDNLHGFCKWESGGLIGNLGADFPHEDDWNLPKSFWDQMPNPGPDVSEEEEDRMMEAWDRQLEEHYWNPNVMNGAIPICHEGCAYRQWLVITGKQKGYVWSDGRASDVGVGPVRDDGGNRVTFTDWYMSWLQSPLKV